MTLTKYIVLFLLLLSSLTLTAQINPIGATDNIERTESEKGTGKEIRRKGTRPMPPNPELFGDRTIDSLENATEAPLSPDKPLAITSTWRMLTLGFTATGYIGDLNYDRTASKSITQVSLRPGLDLSFRKDVAKALLPVFRIGYGKFSAQSAKHRLVRYEYEGEDLYISPNNYAESVLIYGEVGVRFSPFPSSLRIKPYFEAGIGGQSFFPRAQDGILLFRKRSTRAPDEPEYGSFMMYFPLSAGMELQMSTSLTLQISYTLKTLGTDYLDNIGKLGTKMGNDQLHVIRMGLGFRFEDFKKGHKGYE